MSRMLTIAALRGEWDIVPYAMRVPKPRMFTYANDKGKLING